MAKKLDTVGDLLFWSYANLAMAHAAVTDGATRYGRVHYTIRARLHRGLTSGAMSPGSILDDERVNRQMGTACCYCGRVTELTIDHLIAKKAGGAESADNVVWACRSCNSSKGASDLLEWYGSRDEFPPLLLLRRYLKLAIAHCTEHDLLDSPLDASNDGLPFSLRTIPAKYPSPGSLALWAASH